MFNGNILTMLVPHTVAKAFRISTLLVSKLISYVVIMLWAHYMLAVWLSR